MQRVGLRFGVEFGAGANVRRSGLRIPIFELRQQRRERGFGIRIRHRLGEIIARHGLPVKALKIQFHTLGKTIAPDQRLHHAHHFRTFFINGNGVEIINLDITIGTHRMRHRPRIFNKLGATQ